MPGGADLPSMVDTLPTFDEDYGSEGQGSSDGGGAEGGGEGGTGSGEDGEVAQDSGADAGNETGSDSGSETGSDGAQNGPGTRATGGMDSDMGADGPLTAAERVAILDRQLEESTRDFDGIIYDEEQRQREAARERAASEQGSTTAAGGSEASGEREPDFGGGMASAGGGSVGGGIGGRSGGLPPDGVKYPPPSDIPDASDDYGDGIAEQLREAAMREADPEVREKLWNEYRKYKGLEVPES